MRWILLLIGGLAVSGCSSFNREWQKVSQFPPSNDLQGCWQGIWVSDASSHTDQLRCVITKAQDGSYRARFKAKYRKVLTFGYTVALKAEPSDQGFKFQGQADLGWLAGGLYRYEGSADATNFTSTYSCKYDHGTFRMMRAE
jgi:hypothetical protein